MQSDLLNTSQDNNPEIVLLLLLQYVCMKPGCADGENVGEVASGAR